MADFKPEADPFFRRLHAAVAAKLEDETFGVAELAEEMNMSRSTLLRRVKSASGLSVALYIRQLRLKHAKALLQDSSLTVSEVAYKVGFSSSSYFTKCFREAYGYPPSEEVQQSQAVEERSETPLETETAQKSISPLPWIALVVGIVLLIGSTALFWWPQESDAQPVPKTIAVLPFQNDSQDSSNVYLINGLMVALIDNLHQINELQVTSRTTIERYRDVSYTIPELGEELDVSYFVEGSGQKIGDKILLTLRLIDARADTLIWARRYQRETTNIFQLQAEVSTSIAEEIQVFISPEEQELLELPPTDNLLAYDHYLQGLEQIQQETRE
ncbi:MAG: helix-turn-helix domain-containing protein, partial [Bacteroidota bacterium]